jgi:hypothetical protein
MPLSEMHSSHRVRLSLRQDNLFTFGPHIDSTPRDLGPNKPGNVPMIDRDHDAPCDVPLRVLYVLITVRNLRKSQPEDKEPKNASNSLRHPFGHSLNK